MVIYLCFYRGKIRILILNPNLNTYIKGPKSYIIIDTMFIIQPLLSANIQPIHLQYQHIEHNQT